MGTNIITKNLRAIYPHLHEPRVVGKDSVPKYSIRAVIDKSDTQTLDQLNAAINHEINKRWGEKAGVLNIHSPLRDGDGLNSLQKEYDERLHGCYFLDVKNEEAPGVVDANLKPITDPKAISDDDTIKLSLEIYPYENPSRRGISAKLLNVQHVAKAPPKTKRSAAEDFTVIENKVENEEDDFLR
jgi:hypothetical protein